MKLLSLLLIAVSCSAQAPMTLEQYRAELNRWWDAAQLLKDNPGVNAAPEPPDSWTVADGGQQWKVPAAWLRHDLHAKAYQRIQVRLSRMIEASNFTAAEVQNAGDQAAAAKMRAILSRREFNPPDNSWLDELSERFWKKVGEIFKFLFGSIGRVPESETFFWILLIGLGAAGIYFLTRRLLFRPGADSGEAGLAPVSTSRRAWLDFARRAAAAQSAGDYREAVRLAYWAGIYRLEELGQWRADRTRTHREYLRMLPRDSAKYAPLAALTGHFEHAWYAGEPATAAEFQTVADELEELGCLLPTENS
jgi:hypothetical protein